jgi:hypothetical protein
MHTANKKTKKSVKTTKKPIKRENAVKAVARNDNTKQSTLLRIKHGYHTHVVSAHVYELVDSIETGDRIFHESSDSVTKWWTNNIQFQIRNVDTGNILSKKGRYIKYYSPKVYGLYIITSPIEGISNIRMNSFQNLDIPCEIVDVDDEFWFLPLRSSAQRHMDKRIRETIDKPLSNVSHNRVNNFRN